MCVHTTKVALAHQQYIILHNSNSESIIKQISNGPPAELLISRGPCTQGINRKLLGLVQSSINRDLDSHEHETKLDASMTQQIIYQAAINQLDAPLVVVVTFSSQNPKRRLSCQTMLLPAPIAYTLSHVDLQSLKLLLLLHTQHYSTQKSVRI